MIGGPHDFELLSHDFNRIDHVGRGTDVIAQSELKLDGEIEIGVAGRDLRVAENFNRLRQRLAAGDETDRIRARCDDGTDLRRLEAPVGNRARVLAAEPGFFPDTRVLGRRRPHLHEPRRLVAQVPSRSVQSGAAGGADVPDQIAVAVDDLNLNPVVRRCRERVVDDRAAALRPSVGGPRSEQPCGVGRRRILLFERRDVIEHVQSASVRRNDHVVRLLLDHDPAHRGMR